MGSYSRKRYATESASFPKSASSAPGSYSYATFADLPASGSTPGNTAFVVATNKLYIWSGVGWYLIATVTNASPTAITGVSDTYALAIDGTATTVTAVSTDPEGFPLTWSYAVTSGSLAITPAASAIAVVNNGSSAYTLSGGATGDNSNVDIVVGQTVNFTVNASGHPFYIRDSDGGANVSSPAATGQGAISGVVSWTPNTAGTYYYQCGNHAAMVGTITVGAATVTATVAQADNVFTITPSTDAANEGTFSLTFSVTDGLNGVVSSVSAFTLSFFVTNSRYTALSVKATSTGSNQTFDDASTSNHTITTNGDVAASTFSPYRHGGYSLHGDGTGDYLQVPQTTDLDLTGDFTVEMWVYFNELKSQGLIGKWASSAYGWTLYADTSTFGFYSGTGSSAGTLTNFNQTPVVNQWMHVAVSRTSNTISTYINGTRTNTATRTENCTASTTLTIGSDGTALSAWSLNGYMRDVRIVNGTGLYTGTSFAVPTEPLTAVTNTKFLLGRLPYFKDQSASNHTITVGGNVELKPKSLFDNAAYSEASHGASVYLEAGDNDYLSMPAQTIPTGSFTVEGWYYLDGTQSNSTVVSQGSSGNANRLFIGIESFSGTQSLRFQIGSNYVNGPAAVPNIWTHFCATCNGSAMQLFQNGVSAGTTSYSSNVDGVAMFIGRLGTAWSGGYGLKGYVADIRVSSVARQSSNFTLPTAPLTAITNTTFLLNPETSISDLSQSSAITCFGDTATSTTQAKFSNTRSIYGDGSGDYVSMPIDPIGTDDFTVEAWIYPTSMGSTSTAISGATIGGALGVVFRKDQWFIGNNTTNQTFTSAANKFVINQWQHIAMTRQGTSVKLFYNGTQFDSGTNSYNLNQTKYVLFAAYTDGSYLDFAGYIQDFRITKGLARYTSTFTPPTAELQG